MPTATNRRYRLAVIAGDGIGKEVMPEGVRTLEAAAKKHGFQLELDHFDFSSYDYYAKHGQMLPTIGRSRSAAMTRSSSAPSACRPRSPTIFRSGARC